MYEYPDEAIRGLINKTSQYVQNNRPTKSAFKDGFELVGNYHEMSINWYVCNQAMSNIKNSINAKNGKKRYECAVIIPRGTLDMIKLLPGLKDKLDYNQDPIKGNDYHGNIRLKKCSDDMRIEIDNLCSTLCNCASRIEFFD